MGKNRFSQNLVVSFKNKMIRDSLFATLWGSTDVPLIKLRGPEEKLAFSIIPRRANKKGNA